MSSLSLSCNGQPRSGQLHYLVSPSSCCERGLWDFSLTSKAEVKACCGATLGVIHLPTQVQSISSCFKLCPQLCRQTAEALASASKTLQSKEDEYTFPLSRQRECPLYRGRQNSKRNTSRICVVALGSMVLPSSSSSPASHVQCTLKIVISVSEAQSHTERATCSAWSKPFFALFS